MITFYITRTESITPEEITAKRMLPFDQWQAERRNNKIIDWEKVVSILETQITEEQFEKIRKLMVESF